MGRPGVTKSLGEETRRRTLLKEMERRQKIGGIVDRRFGENDPTMTPEERAMERFVREKQKASKKSTLFDLEDDEDAEEELTHFGRSLAFTDGNRVDDFDEAGLSVSDDEAGEEAEDGLAKDPGFLETMNLRNHKVKKMAMTIQSDQRPSRRS